MAERNVQGFKVIPVKYKEDSTVLRCLFAKQHNVREKVPEKPSDRTLFVVNVPPFCNEKCFKRLFGEFGTVSKVHFHKIPNHGVPPTETSTYFPEQPPIKGYKVAYVVFETPKGLESTLKLDSKNPLVLFPADSPIECGLTKWIKEYDKKIVDSKDLQKEIDTFMAEFDEEQKRKELEEKGNNEDEEGWITVTRKGRKPGIARKESVKKRILGKERLKRTKKELKNFYTFQIRESKMKNLEALRKKFEEDKRKISALKQTRRFKPF